MRLLAKGRKENPLTAKGVTPSGGNILRKLRRFMLRL
jgi:hypothetical protein